MMLTEDLLRIFSVWCSNKRPDCHSFVDKWTFWLPQPFAPIPSW